ncbi:hypothetical protein CYLTODRAFT_416914 [Cylindrobasidium torrendii FP15055 ss-10]|uniref:Uncharacterized protein n=1 Tax=Cylindrobasidium torrendii FP15055 ss-10 TaxID=1314674 RepID=A0A0D7BTF0_9AGAR|nr:hypothetical protein CYLTODRAFT_416914 [Cylindrobasidium torrendii FP15055 ss-10]
MRIIQEISPSLDPATPEPPPELRFWNFGGAVTQKPQEATGKRHDISWRLKSRSTEG